MQCIKDQAYIWQRYVKYYAPGVAYAAADDSNDFSKTRILAKNETYFSYYLGEFQIVKVLLTLYVDPQNSKVKNLGRDMYG